MSWLDELTFDSHGLLPVIAQERDSGEVLMLAYANREALERTVATGEAHYWSRSRGELWRKGATSGHSQAVVEVRADCDGDAVVYLVRQTGPACHTLQHSCFHRRLDEGAWHAAGSHAHMLERLEAIVTERHAQRPEGSYTTYLFREGVDKILKKVGEEATEVVIAAKNRDPEGLRGEAADLLFHLLVLLREQGLPLSAVWEELDSRFGRTPRARRDQAPAQPHS